MGTYNSTLDLNLGHVSGIEDDEIARALLDIHNALEILATNLAGTGDAALLGRVMSLETQMAPLYSVVTKSTNYVVPTSVGTVLVDASANDVTVTLPPAIGNSGYRVNVKKIGTGFLADVATDAAETIDGSSSNFNLYQHESVTLQSDGSNWWII